MSDVSRLFELLETGCPTVWIRLHRRPKHWDNIDDTIVPLERNRYGHPLAGLLVERRLEEVLLQEGWDKVPGWEWLYAHRHAQLFLSVHADDKNGWKKQQLSPYVIEIAGKD